MKCPFSILNLEAVDKKADGCVVQSGYILLHDTGRGMQIVAIQLKIMSNKVVKAVSSSTGRRDFNPTCKYMYMHMCLEFSCSQFDSPFSHGISQALVPVQYDRTSGTYMYEYG